MARSHGLTRPNSRGLQDEVFDVSVVLATFNGERFLPALLESLRAQTHLPAELVAVDDASEDRTLKLLEAFAREAPFPVRVMASPVRKGAHSQFRAGVRQSRHGWIAFCDQDDLWHPEKLARCAFGAAATPDVGLVVHSGRIIDEDSRPTGTRWPDLPTRVVPPLGWDWSLSLPGFAQIFSRRLLDLAPISADALSSSSHAYGISHDEWVQLHAFVSADAVFLDDELVGYRRHADNLSSDPRGRTPTVQPLVADYKDQARRAEERATYFRSLGRNTELGAAVAYFERQAEMWQRRVQVFEKGRWLRPLQLIAMCLYHRDYRARTRGGLGGRSLVKDVVGAVRSGVHARGDGTGNSPR